MTDNKGYVRALVPVAPVHETDMVLFPDGLKALKRVAKEVGLDRRDASGNRDNALIGAFTWHKRPVGSPTVDFIVTGCEH